MKIFRPGREDAIIWFVIKNAGGLIILCFFFCVLLTLKARPGTARVPAVPGSIKPNEAARVRVSETYGRLPLSFEANEGQQDRAVKFLSKGSGYTLFLTNQQAVLALTKPAKSAAPMAKVAHHLPQKQKSESYSTVLRTELIGANPAANVFGEDKLLGKVNYFIGSDPSKWRTNAATYAKVRYEQVYPGIDLIYYGNQQELEYDFVVAPGSNPDRIRMGLIGAERIRLDREGQLIVEVSGSEVRWKKPTMYQIVGGARHSVAGKYLVKNSHEIAFQIERYEKSQPLIIDPILSYSTFLGGAKEDDGLGIVVDGAGNAYITGETLSADFPTTNGAFQATNHVNGSRGTAFVTKLNPAGTALVYSTYVGGSTTGSGFIAFDLGSGIAVDGTGNAYITGGTTSTDFPTTSGAFQTTNRATNNYTGFVTKLNPTGTALIYSTYIGGSNLDIGNGIAVDGSGNAYITGGTTSTDFPTTSGAFQTTNRINNNNNGTAFVTELNPAGTALVYSTYIGGSTGEIGNGIAVNGTGNAYMTGSTSSTDFPTTSGAFQTLKNTFSRVAFVTKLNPAGTALVYSTYVGGSNFDVGNGITVDGSGNAYITGKTTSADFPTTSGAFQTTNRANNNGTAFVTKLNPTGAALVYSTYVGGSNFDVGNGIAVDGSGNAYITGGADSTDFPTTTDAFQTTTRTNTTNAYTAFMTELNPAGTALVYSTYIGGSSGGDEGYGIAVDNAGSAYITGRAFSTDFPTTGGAFQTTNKGGDAFVSKFAVGNATPTPTPTPTPFPTTLQYVVTDLGTLGGSSSAAAAVNNLGQVTGNSSLANGQTHAFLYPGAAGLMQDLGTLGGTGSVGSAINGYAQIAGTSSTANNASTDGFVFSNGALSDVAPSTGSYQIRSLTSITNGLLVGVNLNDNQGNENAYILDASSSTSTYLGSLNGDDTTINSLNANRQATGWSVATTGGNSLSAHAFLYDGTMHDIGSFDHYASTSSFSVGYDINSAGQVAGKSYSSDGSAHAFLYSGGGLFDVGKGEAYSVNASAQLTGILSSGSAFVWYGGSSFTLQNLIPSTSGFSPLIETPGGKSINDLAQIVTTSNGHAILLTPRNMGTQFSGGLGSIPGPFNSVALGVSNGGTEVAGNASNALGVASFDWNLLSGMLGFGDNTSSIGSSANAVSADGTTVVGTNANGGHPTAYSHVVGGSTTLLPGLASGQTDANAVSRDGTFIAGGSIDTAGDAVQAVRWQSGGAPLALGFLPGGVLSNAGGISGDGSIVVGQSTSTNSQSVGEAFRWTQATGLQGLADLPGGVIASAAVGISDDGKTIVGYGTDAVGNQPVRWVNGGAPQALGDLAGRPTGYARSVSADGGVIVGTCVDPTNHVGQLAFVWDQAHGIQVLASVLVSEYGATWNNGWNLSDAFAISPDATEIVGYGTGGATLGNNEAFAAQINSRTYRFMSGESYAGFHTSHLGGFGTAVDLLGGTAGGATKTFRALTVDTQTNHTAISSASDIATVNGSAGDTYGIQLSYDPVAASNSFGGDQSLVLGWFNGTSWVNALDGDSGGTPMFIGAYDGDTTLGDCGVDATKHVVWAVVNHTGPFMVLNHISPVSTFAKWQQAYFNAQQLSDPTVSGDTADPDGDGLPNLLEYAFNTDPTKPSSANRPYEALDSNYLSLIYTKLIGATDLTYTVEESVDLVNWVVASPANAILSDNGVTQLIKAQVPRTDAGSGGKLFLRLRVSH